ncbi:MAG: hypothetical protein GEU95_01065 [Rhizobiales bacterium]|nr:hypothetical protein [Hyphomicrobiales bacterium]
MTEAAEPRTAADVMAKWPTDADFARDIGVKPTHAQTMKVRDSIPPGYWPAVVVAAAKRNIQGLTLEVLAKIAALKLGREAPLAPEAGQTDTANADN